MPPIGVSLEPPPTVLPVARLERTSWDEAAAVTNATNPTAHNDLRRARIGDVPFCLGSYLARDVARPGVIWRLWPPAAYQTLLRTHRRCQKPPSPAQAPNEMDAGSPTTTCANPRT